MIKKTDPKITGIAALCHCILHSTYILVITLPHIVPIVRRPTPNKDIDFRSQAIYVATLVYESLIAFIDDRIHTVSAPSY